MRFRNTYSDGDGTTLAGALDGERVRLTEVAAPVTSPDGDDGELGDDDGGTDGSGDFLGGLDTETNVALRVTDDNDSLETGALTGLGLLLDGLDLLVELRLASIHSSSFRSHIPSSRSSSFTFLTSLQSSDAQLPSFNPRDVLCSVFVPS